MLVFKEMVFVERVYFSVELLCVFLARLFSVYSCGPFVWPLLKSSCDKNYAMDWLSGTNCWYGYIELSSRVN